MKEIRMTYQFEVMTQEQAEDISYNWHYEGEYSFYDMEADEEDLQEFVDPKLRGDSKFAVMNNSDLIGFFSVTKVANLIYDIGLGMRPDLTNKGKGLEFISAGLDFIKKKYNPSKITLSVATFNQRAIKVYRRLGFKDVHTFMQDTNGSTFEFLKMEYER
jgi:[ribosomal protein S18]-alanine N-acetyltransferase